MSAFVSPSKGEARSFPRSLRTLGMRCVSWLLLCVFLSTLGVMAQQSPQRGSARQALRRAASAAKSGGRQRREKGASRQRRQKDASRQRQKDASRQRRQRDAAPPSSDPSRFLTPPKTPQFVPDELLIKFRPTVSPDRRNAVLKENRAQVVRSFHMLDIQHIRLRRGTDLTQAIAAFRAYPEVLYAERNGIVHVALTPNDPRFSELYGLHNTGQVIQGVPGTPDADIDAPEAWDISPGSSSVIVAVVDTGIDYNHPDLVANVWTNPVDGSHGYNAITKTNDPLDDNGHGTHVSGTIGAVGNNGIGVVGVNWNVQLIGVKFLDAFGSGSLADAIDGMNWILDQKVNQGTDIRVANHSWGGSFFSQALKNAFDAVANAGVVNVCAAGNSANNNDTFPFYPSNFDTPGLIAVAASDNNDAPASFTNFGATTVDLAAPGVSILSTVPTFVNPSGYEYFDGTSMSSPHVAGACALILSLDPTLTIDAVKTFILNSVDVLPQWGPGGGTPVLTSGRLNVATAASNFLTSDLVIQSVLIPNSARGVQLAAQITVRNIGRAVTTPFFVDFYQNRTTAPPPGTVGDARRTVPGLGVGGSTTLTFNFTPATIGAFTAWVQVDTADQVSERDETNNIGGPSTYRIADTFVFDTFTDTNGKLLSDHKPDINLTLDRWSVSPPGTVTIQNNEAVVGSGLFGAFAVIDSGKTDGVIEANMRLGNFGGIVFRQTSPDTYFVVHLDSNAPDGQQLSLLKVQQNQGTYLARRRFKITSGTTYRWRIELVKARITVFVDNVKYIEAVDAFNQSATHVGLFGRGATFDNYALFVDTPTQPVQPDLTIQSLAVTPRASTPGTQLTATMVVKNEGIPVNRSFAVDFYQNLTSAPGGTQGGDNRWIVPSLGQGASTTLTFNFTPSGAGTFHAWAQVDTDNQVTDENNEHNNLTGPLAYFVTNALVQDTFTDTDGKLLPLHKPEVNQPGGSWNVAGSVSAVVQSGEARLAGSGSGFVTAAINGGTADGTVDADTHMLGGRRFSGVLFRWTDANNYLFARADSNDVGQELGLARVQNGVTTFLGKVGSALNAGRIYHWRIELSGANIKVFFDGVKRFDVNESFSQTATHSGLLWVANGGGENTAFDNFTVTGPVVPPAQPDLTIQSLTVTPVISQPSTLLTAKVMVRNQGSNVTSSFAVDLYENLASAPSSGQASPQRQTLSSLAAGATATFTFTFTPAAQGTFQAWAQVDTDGQIAESDETNNVAGPLSYTVATTIPENVRDTFTDVDGTLLTQHAPDINKPGGSWNVTGPVSAQTQGGQAKVSGAGGDFVLATVNCSASNGTVEVDAEFSTTGLLYSGVIFRASNLHNYFVARADSSDRGGELALVRVQNGVGTYLGRTAQSLSAGATHTWRVELLGATIRVLFNGTKRFEVIESFNQTATQHGIQWFAGNGGENTAFDNFAMTPAANGTPSRVLRRFSPGLYLLALPSSPQKSHALAATQGVKLARWNSLSGQWSEVASPPSAGESGEGYWARFTSEVTLTAPVEGTAAGGAFTFSLTAGWNLIGYPFLTPMPVDWDSLRVRETSTGAGVSFRDAVQRGWLDEVLWTYQGAEGYRMVHPTFPDALRTWEPWQGYWVRVTRPLRLTVPAPESVQVVKRSSVRTSAPGDWSLTLIVRDGNGQDSAVLGVSSALPGDHLALKPPPTPEAAPAVYFPTAPSGQPLPYAVNLRQSLNGQTAWDIEVLPSPGQSSVNLSWPDMTQLPRNVRLTLVDLVTNKRYYMRTHHGVTVPTNGAAPRRFKLIVSTDTSGRRLLNALNATGGRGSTPVRISFVLGSEADVTMEILSPTGKVISRTPAPVRRSVGLNTLFWDGKDPVGRVVARGIYLLRVTAADDEGRTMALMQTLSLGR